MLPLHHAGADTRPTIVVVPAINDTTSHEVAPWAPPGASWHVNVTFNTSDIVPAGSFTRALVDPTYQPDNNQLSGTMFQMFGCGAGVGVGAAVV